MTTYMVIANADHGFMVYAINADSVKEAEQMAKDDGAKGVCGAVEINTTSKGIVFVEG